MAENEQRIQPVRLTDTDTGSVYELDFNRDSVRFAEARGFKPDDIFDYPATKVSEFFFYAFRMHHKSLARDKTDKILEAMGGLTAKVTERLLGLYEQAALSNTIQSEEDLEKNARVTVEM